MLKKLSILFVFAAILSAMVHDSIPHHEHGESICFEQIYGNENAARNDCADDIHPCCFSEQDDAIRLQYWSVDIIGYAVCCNHCFPSTNLSFIPNPVEIINKPYLNLYTSAVLTATNALRGPPQG